jgi:hypothetical protein
MITTTVLLQLNQVLHVFPFWIDKPLRISSLLAFFPEMATRSCVNATCCNTVCKPNNPQLAGHVMKHKTIFLSAEKYNKVQKSPGQFCPVIQQSSAVDKI